MDNNSREHFGASAQAGRLTHTDHATSVVDVPVSGIDCSGCVNTVELGLASVPGVRSVTVDLAAGQANVIGDRTLDPSLLHDKVTELGFSVGAEPDGSVSPGFWKRLAIFGVVGGVVAAVGIYAYLWFKDYYLASGSIPDLNSFFASTSFAAVGLAFLFGLVIAFSPFTFALAPAVMGYVAGGKHGSRRDALRSSAGFVGGIVTVDVAMGALFATIGIAAISFFSRNLPVWYAILTMILLGLALVLLRIWKIRMPVFRPKLHEVRSVRGAYLMGLPFGLIACPGCTPLLLPVALGAAATGNAVYGAALMGAFALGRGIPLVALGTSTAFLQRAREFARYVPWVEKTVGLLLLAGAAFFAKEFFRVAGAFNWFGT